MAAMRRVVVFQEDLAQVRRGSRVRLIMVGVQEANEGSLEVATLESPFVLLATFFAVL